MTNSGKNALAKMLRRPEMTYPQIPSARTDLPKEVSEQVEIRLKYESYIERQEAEVLRFKTMEDKQIPTRLDYALVHSLRREARQKLSEIRPRTIGQASRISGVSPADISILLISLKRGNALPPELPASKDTPEHGCAAEEHGDEPNAHNSCCGDL